MRSALNQALNPATNSGTHETRIQAIFNCLDKAGSLGRTDDELEVLLKIRHETVSSERRSLVKQGWVCESGQQRQTRRGYAAKVWVINRAVA